MESPIKKDQGQRSRDHCDHDHGLCFCGYGHQGDEGGAYDYITKPFKVDEIKLIIKKRAGKEESPEGEHSFEASGERSLSFGNIIGQSPKWWRCTIF